jgi:hypothetical protein
MRSLSETQFWFVVAAVALSPMLIFWIAGVIGWFLRHTLWRHPGVTRQRNVSRLATNLSVKHGQREAVRGKRLLGGPASDLNAGRRPSCQRSCNQVVRRMARVSVTGDIGLWTFCQIGP